MEFEATVKMGRTSPIHSLSRTFTFEAEDWDDAQVRVIEAAKATGYSAYGVTEVTSLERLM